jgi:hypothetical protein
MSEALRYVVLRHEGVDEPHFDLMFETTPASDLATWRADQWPFTDQTTFTPLRPHRRAYLQHEGPISGDRGTVHRIHCGTHEVVENGASDLVVRLETGETLLLPKKPGSR